MNASKCIFLIIALLTYIPHASANGPGVKAVFSTAESGIGVAVKISGASATIKPAMKRTDTGVVAVFSGGKSPGVFTRLLRTPQGIRATFSPSLTAGITVVSKDGARPEERLQLMSRGAIRTVFASAQTPRITVVFSKAESSEGVLKLPLAIPNPLARLAPYFGKDKANLLVGANLDFLNGTKPKSTYFNVSAGLRDAFTEEQKVLPAKWPSGKGAKTVEFAKMSWRFLKKRVSGLEISFTQDRSATQLVTGPSADTLWTQLDTLSFPLSVAADTVSLIQRFAVRDSIADASLLTMITQSQGPDLTSTSDSTDMVSFVLNQMTVRQQSAEVKQRIESTIFSMNTFFPLTTFENARFNSDIKLALYSEVRQRRIVHTNKAGESVTINGKFRARNAFGPSVIIEGKHVIMHYAGYWNSWEQSPLLAQGYVYSRKTGLIVGAEIFGLNKKLLNKEENQYSVYVARRFPLESIISLIKAE